MSTLPMVLGRLTSSNVQKVLWALDELGEQFQHENIGGPWGGNRHDDYLRKNPNGTVPTMMEGDAVIWESNTILRYLINSRAAPLSASARAVVPSSDRAASMYPQAPLPRSVVDRWLDWQLGTLAPAFRPLYVGLVREGKSLAALTAQRAENARLFALLDSQLGDSAYLAGPALSLADIAIGPTLHRWYALGLADDGTGNLKAWYDLLCTHAGFQKRILAVDLA